MEVMEEGNLMDRVPILLQRDMQFYQTHQRVLQEPICSAVVGGKLDFPRYASFAAIKMILWWEDEYYAAYRKYSGLLHKEKTGKNSAISVKSSDPEKFVSLVTKSADLLLEHLHILSQEALDHADLSVLSATIGAASLVKNCLNVYMLAATVKFCVPKGDEKGGALKLSHKQYSEMSEALAERLLDLHCRLLLLYIIQDADCLNWEDKDAFFESERGSYTIQMWWHYMKGTKDDLWNSIPPKMAERIFAGILNETLSVLTVRYSQNVISPERTRLHLDDICNMLFCIAELLQYVCERGEAYIGLNISNQSVIVRDVHSKCKELFFCLLLQGAPLGVLSKVFRKGLEDMSMFQSRNGLPSSWIVFALQRFFNQGATSTAMNGFLDLSSNMAVLLELKVMLAAPEADWSYLLKTLLMREAVLVKIILTHLLKCLPASENFKDVSKFSFLDDGDEAKKCEAFLCRGECFNIFQMIDKDNDPVGQSNYQIVLSVSYLLLCVGKTSDIKAALIRPLETTGCNGKWSDCLDKREVWNQKRPPWLEAIMHFVYPILDSVIELLIGAVETGATMYQAMSLALTCISELWDCIPKSLYNITELLQGIIPVSTKPLSDSVLIQIIFAALYTQLTIAADKFKLKAIESKSSICSTLAAAICYIDEDDKHTDQIQLFLKQAQESLQLESDSDEFKSYAQSVRDVSAASTAKIDNTIIDMDRINYSPCSNYGAAGGNGIELDVDVADYVAEVHASEILMSKIGRQALKVSYNYLKHNMQWLVEQLSGIVDERNSFQCIRGQNINGSPSSVAKSMFFIEDIPFDRHLAGSFKIDYIQWLQTPLSLNPERAWLHLSRRSDFQENAKLSLSEMAMVARICNIMKKHS